VVDNIIGSLPTFARQALPISLAAWLAIQLVYQSIRQGEGFFFEGIYTFLAVWSLITVVNYRTSGESLPAISAFTYSLLAIGAFVSLIRVVMWLFSPKRRSS
jgi:hypothetical protein